jgi:hypothetical protein
MVRNLSPVGLALALALALVTMLAAAPGGVSFSLPAASIEAYDFIEVTASVTAPDGSNPFTGAALTGSFGKADATTRVPVDGFCDSPDGSVFRIRFMPSSAGEYVFSVAGRFREDIRGPLPSHRGVQARFPFAWIRNTPGTSFGKAPENIISSMAPPPSGRWAGARKGLSTAPSSACTA